MYIYRVDETNRHRLSNEKPSAIFRLRGTFTPNSTAFSSTPSVTVQSDLPPADVTAILGLAIEPLGRIQQGQVVAATHVSGNAPGPDATLLAERIVKNLFHYVSGFVPGVGGGVVAPDSVVPMGVVAKWYEKFLSKVRAGGIGFLEREE
jgi:hypothetical protein